jgi:hypothetical protein
VNFSLEVTLVAVLLAASGQAIAADFDGSKPLICALVETVDCSQDGSCSNGSPLELDLPIFVEVDVGAGMIKGRRHDGGPDLSAPISNVTQQATTLALHGAQNERAWNLVISKTDGTMTATIADVESGFLLFGTCTPMGSP